MFLSPSFSYELLTISKLRNEDPLKSVQESSSTLNLDLTRLSPLVLLLEYNTEKGENE